MSHVIYFSQSQLLLTKTNEHRTIIRKAQLKASPDTSRYHSVMMLEAFKWALNWSPLCRCKYIQSICGGTDLMVQYAMLTQILQHK